MKTIILSLVFAALGFTAFVFVLSNNALLDDIGSIVIGFYIGTASAYFADKLFPFSTSPANHS